MKKATKLGPVIPWDTEPAAQPAGMSGTQRQVQRQLRIAEPGSDATVTAMPSGRTHDELNTAGCYRARRHPGAE